MNKRELEASLEIAIQGHVAAIARAEKAEGQVKALTEGLDKVMGSAHREHAGSQAYWDSCEKNSCSMARRYLAFVPATTPTGERDERLK